MEPKISVVMPFYRETIPVLQRTIDSVLSQTFKDFELVAVLDNPSYEEAAEFMLSVAARDSRVRLVRNEVNRGVWGSYNRGIRESQGKYLGIQDADDISDPTRLEILYRYMVDHPEVDVVGCSLVYVDSETGKELMIRRYPPDAADCIRRYCPLAHATTLRKRDLHERFGYYDESERFRCTADYDLWLRWFAQGVVMRSIPDVLYTYLQNPGNIKTLNTKRILRQSCAIKWEHASKTGFGPLDYIYLSAEMSLQVLPESAIRSLFYLATKARQSRLQALQPAASS